MNKKQDLEKPQVTDSPPLGYCEKADPFKAWTEGLDWESPDQDDSLDLGHHPDQLPLF